MILNGYFKRKSNNHRIVENLECLLDDYLPPEMPERAKEMEDMIRILMNYRKNRHLDMHI